MWQHLRRLDAEKGRQEPPEEREDAQRRRQHDGDGVADVTQQPPQPPGAVRAGRPMSCHVSAPDRTAKSHTVSA